MSGIKKVTLHKISLSTDWTLNLKDIRVKLSTYFGQVWLLEEACILADVITSHCCLIPPGTCNTDI